LQALADYSGTNDSNTYEVNKLTTRTSELVSWSLTSLFSTNMAISETTCTSEAGS